MFWLNNNMNFLLFISSREGLNNYREAYKLFTDWFYQLTQLNVYFTDICVFGNAVYNWLQNINKNEMKTLLQNYAPIKLLTYEE